MRILLLGDIVGRAGRNLVCSQLPKLKEQYQLDFVVINGENAAAGFGITEKIHEQLLEAGADVITTGNHVWDQRETMVFIERHPNLLRPLNFPEGTPGKGAGLFMAKNGAQVLVLNALGQVFMSQLVNCPFAAIEQEIKSCALGEQADVILVDFHAEVTSEKQGMGHFCDGRVSAVVGTHTHSPTADDHILPNGTAYISDIGMCGNYDSVLGMDKEEPVNRFITKLRGGRFTPADKGQATLSGYAVDVDLKTGLAINACAFRKGGVLRDIIPPFWTSTDS